MESKAMNLISRKKEELNLEIVKHQFSNNGDLHVFCKRNFDNKYVVWTSYCTGEIKTSYNNFYNGSYLGNIEQATLEFVKRTVHLEINSQVILIKSAAIKLIEAPREICFKEFAYPQLDVEIIELINLDGEFAILVDEEGLFNERDHEHTIMKEHQVVAHFVGNGMIVNISSGNGDINSLTDDDIEKFNSLYVMK